MQLSLAQLEGPLVRASVQIVTCKVAGAFKQAPWRPEKGMPKLPGEC